MRKTLLRLLIIIVFALAAVAVVGCKPKVPPGPPGPPEPPGPGDNDPPVVQLIELNAPTGLSLSGDVVSWGRVENASGYVVKIEGTNFNVTVPTTETSCSLLSKLSKDGAFDVTVKSVGDNVTYKDSDYSAEKATYYCGKISATVLEFSKVDGGYGVTGFKENQSTPFLMIPSTVDGIAVVSICENAFRSDDAITSVYIPDSVKSLDNRCFLYAQKLTSVCFLGGKVEIGEEAFGDCGKLKSIVIKDGTVSIGKRAFKNSVNVTFGEDTFNHIVSIGEEAFLKIPGNSKGETVIPDSVVSVGARAFANFYPQRIVIGASLRDIGDDAFGYLKNLREIVVSKDNPYLEVSGKCLIDKTKNKVVIGLPGAKIPSTVTSIGVAAFQYRTDIEQLTLSPNITEIGERAFANCTNINYLSMSDNLKIIGKEAFKECESLTRVTLGKGITEVSEGAFEYCYSLGSVTMTNEVISLGKSAFSGCYSLKKVTFSDTLTTIGEDCFSGCSILENVEIPKSVTEIGSGAFEYCKAIVSIAIPDGVKEISWLFAGCVNLEYVKLSAQLQTIGEFSFWDCVKLSSIAIPDGVTCIERSAFKGCSKLSGIELPDGVTVIKDYAFFDCVSLTSIDFNAKLTTIKKGAFWNSGLTKVNVPDNVTTVEARAFASCPITSVRLPKNLAGFEADVFYNCVKLEYIETALSLKDLSRILKSGSQSLKSVIINDTTVTDDVAQTFPNVTYYIQSGKAPSAAAISKYGLSANVIVNGCNLAEDGSIASITVSEGSICNYVEGKTINPPQKSGYTFGGWVTYDGSGNIDKTYASAVELISLPTGTTVYANWIKAEQNK